MRSFFNRHREFIGHVAVLMSGRTLAALIALGTTPIVARLFTPADFGVAAVFFSIISIIAQGSSLRYEGAIALPKGHDEALAIMALAYRILLGVTTLLLVSVGIYQATGWHWATLDLLGIWAWLLPVGVLLAGAQQVQESWLVRIKAFQRTSASLVVNNITTSGTRIGFGAWLGSSVWGLISTQLLGMFLQFVVQKHGAGEGRRVAFRRYEWRVLKDLAARYSDFPKLNASAAIIRSVGSNLPVLFFGVLFSPAVAGFYAMANRLSRVPLGIVAESIRRVFLQKAAAIRNRGGSLGKSFRLVVGGLAATGTVPFVIVWLYGQPMLTLLLGERWSIAGHYLEIMAPWLLSVWVAAPCNAVFVVLREQRFFLVRQTALTVARIVALIVTYWLTRDPEWTLYAFVTVAVIANVLTIIHALRVIARHSRQPAPSQTPLQ